MPGIGEDLMAHPRHPPHGKQRVAAVGNRMEISDLLVEHRRGDAEKSQRHRRSFSPCVEPWHARAFYGELSRTSARSSTRMRAAMIAPNTTIASGPEKTACAISDMPASSPMTPR